MAFELSTSYELFWFVLFYNSILLAGLTTSIWVGIRALGGGQVVGYEPRQPVPWRFLDVLVVVALWIFLQGGASFALHQVLALPSIEDVGDEAIAARTHAIAPMLLVDSLAKLLAITLGIGWLKVASGATWRDLGFVLRRFGYDFQLGAIAFAAILVPVYAIQAVLTTLLKFEYEHPVMKMMLDSNNRATYLVAFAAAVVVAPLVEEFLFRVLLQGWLEAHWERTTPVRLVPAAALSEGESSAQPATIPRLAAGPIIVSALVFALAHYGLGPSPIPLFVLALALGYLYRQTHRIWPSLIVHALLNGCSLLMVILGSG